MTHSEKEQKVKALSIAIRSIHDFPSSGIIYKDISPVLSDAVLFKSAIDLMYAQWQDGPPDYIAAIDARGFLFGGALALKFNAGLIPIRKAGKLPYETYTESYALEYGEAKLQIHRDAIVPGARVLVIDDILATGGTAAAAVKLVEALRGEVMGIQFLMSLDFLNGIQKIAGYPVSVIIHED